MSLNLLEHQVEQARANLDALLDRLAQLPAEQQSAALAELQAVNARLEMLRSPSPAVSDELRDTAHVVQARMQAILNSITSLAVIYDEAGLVKITNRFAEDMFGFDPTNMQRKMLMDRLLVRDARGSVVLPEQMPAARAASGEIVEGELLEITNARGRVYSIFASAYPVIIDGRLMGAVSVWDDITDYKRTEKALEDAHAAMVNERNRLMAAMEALPVGLSIVDTRGGVALFNRAFEAVWGGPPPETPSINEYDAYKAWWVESGERLRPEEWASALVLTTGQPVTGQYLKIQRFDGTTGYVINSAAPIHDAQGQVTGGAVTIMDITERVEAEDALRESERVLLEANDRYRQLADAMPQLTFSANPDGAVDYFNQRVREYSGFSQREDQFWDWDTVVHPEDRTATLEAWQNTVRTGKGYQLEHRLRMAHGAYHWHLTRVVPALDEDGRVVKIYGAATDIEEQKQVEKALRESERRFQVALSALPMTVYTMDKNLHYTWIYNPRFGLPADQLLSHRDDAMAMHTTPELLEVKKSVIESGQGVRREIRTFLQGEWKYYLLSLEPLRDSQGSLIGLIGASLDVTEQRKIELEHRETVMQIEVQRRLMENREKERQQIARDIHDGPIQTLVSNIFNIQMAKETTEHPDMVRELDQIGLSLKNSVRELRDVVNELRPPALLHFGLGRALAIYAEDFRDKHREINLNLTCDLPDEGVYLPERVTLTFYRICQEGVNNVVRHAEAANIWLHAEQRGGQVFLGIRDDGKGFVVPDNMTEQTVAGHFGLVGMKERVNAIGGVMEIISSPGSGTRIEIQVPVEQGETDETQRLTVP